MARRRALEGYLYISPFLLGFAVFTAYPLLASLYLSFTNFNLITSPVWVGLDNYVRAFSGDNLFWSSLGRTAQYAVIVVPLGIAASLGAALLLSHGFRGTSIFRTFFFLPSITPIIASVLIWLWILQPSIGVLNYLLSLVRIPGPPWVQSTTWAIPSLILLSLWNTAGGTRMIVFLAGLQGVPVELYDAAKIDGANAWQRFVNVTVPLISPTIFFNVIVSIIGALSVFSVAYIGTQGGPAYATYFYVYHLYTTAFQYSLMGYAAALAWIFLVIVLCLTAIQFRLQHRWVYYAAEAPGGADAT
ncbi:MAG: sugar ABC transporter permease [Chloroflexi bacterium]|nr:sugar ABC transporter permease [Chloroflexota bacterium]MBV9543969.1 sugar ABC transporter permease [Chloroflexota bacterium]